MIDKIVMALAEIEARFESVVFDEFQRRDADRVLTILQNIIAAFLNELKEATDDQA